MRKQFVKTVTEMLEGDYNHVLLLGDIGVFGFRDAAIRFPGRVCNVGILEQATVSMAAGLAMTGFIPIVHTIAPFLVERAYEQLKIDFGYQDLPGIFVSVGASFDYASLGCTHHCPADVSLIENIPGFEIYVPGNQTELDKALKAPLTGPRYIRMSEHSYKLDLEFIKIDPTQQACVISVGPAVEMSLAATADLPITHVYSSTVNPFPLERLCEPLKAGIKKFFVVEPYFSSHLANKVRAFARAAGQKVDVYNFSVPRQFYRHYGKREQHYEEAEFTAPCLKEFIQSCLT